MEINIREIVEKEINRAVGDIEKLERDRKGYAFEAVQMMISTLMEDMKLDLILLGACEKNKASLSMENYASSSTQIGLWLLPSSAS